MEKKIEIDRVLAKALFNLLSTNQYVVSKIDDVTYKVEKRPSENFLRVTPQEEHNNIGDEGVIYASDLDITEPNIKTIQ